MADKPLSLVHVATIPVSVKAFLLGHIRYASARGATVEVVCGKDDYVEDLAAEIGVPVHQLPLRRSISPLHDLLSIWRMRKIFRRLKPDVIHAHTPKGGLIGMIAGFLARVPNRVYTVHGLSHMTRTGWKRRLLMATEFISCRLAHRVLCVSYSVREVLVEEGLCKPDKVGVVGHGSICGVDRKRFTRSPEVLARAHALREKLGLPENELVLGFVGRLVRDKGVVELDEAWTRLKSRFAGLHLLIVGAFEEGDPVPESVRRSLESDERVHITGWQSDVVPYMAMMDVLALPTYREGFVLVLLEAAAMGIPTVASRIPGCVDAVEDTRTGFLVPVRDAEALAQACERLIEDASLRSQMGEAGARYVAEYFEPEPIYTGHYAEYLALIARRG